VLDREAVTEPAAQDLHERYDDEAESGADTSLHAEGSEGAVRGSPRVLVVGDAVEAEGGSARGTDDAGRSKGRQRRKKEAGRG
jgi:hypothetical protein